jgi:hypothetical protein
MEPKYSSFIAATRFFFGEISAIQYLPITPQCPYDRPEAPRAGACTGPCQYLRSCSQSLLGHRQLQGQGDLYVLMEGSSRTPSSIAIHPNLAIFSAQQVAASRPACPAAWQHRLCSCRADTEVNSLLASHDGGAMSWIPAAPTPTSLHCPAIKPS